MRKREVIAYMVSVADDHYDGIDVSLTHLAEDCAGHVEPHTDPWPGRGF